MKEDNKQKVEEIPVSVNLKKGTAIVQRINRVELFENPAKTFVIELMVAGSQRWRS
jgi:hypothetical protein